MTTDQFQGITECMAHTSSVDDDCDYCRDEVALKQSKVHDMLMANELRLKNFNAQAVQIDPSNFLSARLELFIEVVIRDERSRTHFEAEYQRRITESLENLKAEVSKAKLTAGVNGIKPARGPSWKR